MPPRELEGYIKAANTIAKESEPEKQGVSGEAALEAMKFDPAIKVL